MDDWFTAIEEFHRCKVDEVSEDESKGGKIKTKITREGMTDIDEIADGEGKMIDDLTKTYMTNSETESKKEKAELDLMFKKMYSEYKKHKDKERMERLRLRMARTKISEQNKKQRALQKCIEDSLQVKAIEDQKNIEGMINEVRDLRVNEGKS